MIVSKFQRGQVWYAEHNPLAVGSEQGKKRPWVILSNNRNNFRSTVLNAAPITTRDKDDYPFHVYFENSDGRHQVIELEQITCMSVLRFDSNDYLYTLDDETMKQVDEAIKVQLGLIDKYNHIPGLDFTTKVVRKSAVEKFNDRYNKTINKSNHRNKWTKELISEYVKDSKVMALSDLANKYGLKSSNVAAQYKSRFIRMINDE